VYPSIAAHNVVGFREGSAHPQHDRIAISENAPLSQSITIHFDPGARSQPEFLDIHKFRNFTEALSLELERTELGLLPMDEADRATTYVRITGIRKRDTRRCLALIKALLEKHYMTDEADVRVEDHAG
jgi:hypothetical protein